MASETVAAESPMEARIARLESDIGHLRSDVTEVKVDLRSLRDQFNSRIDQLHSRIDRLAEQTDNRFDLFWLLSPVLCCALHDRCNCGYSGTCIQCVY